MTEAQIKAKDWNDKIEQLEQDRDSRLARIKEQMDGLKKKIRETKYAIPQDTGLLNQLNSQLITLQDRYDTAKTYFNNEIGKIKDNDGYEDLETGKRDDLIDAQNFAVGSEGLTEGVKKTVDTVKAQEGKHNNLSDSFYRDIASAMTNGRPGNVFSDSAATQKEQARNQQNESANRQKEAQNSQQIANRSEYTEAGKVASMQNDAQNRQNIANKEGISGAAAALTRQTNTPDIASERQRQDQQRNIANNRMELSDAAQQGSTESQGLSAEFGHKSDEYNSLYDKSQDLARGVTLGYGNQNNQGQGTQDQDTKPKQPEMDTKPADTTPDTPKTESDNTGTTQTETEEQGQETEVPPTGLSDTIDEAYFNKLIDEANAQFPDKVGGARGGDRYTERNNYIQNALKQNNAWAALPAEDQKKWTSYFTSKITSDCHVKDIKGMLARHKKAISDCRMKIIKHDFDTFGRPDPEDFKWLMGELAQRDNAADYGIGYDEDDNTVLKGYADNIRNYVYNYKPEAQALSPDNDPNVTHIGPMAQDIEKVNPACISKDANGIESVDTGRVAMMNAGAIGDLARSLEDIKARLIRLEEQNGR